MTTLWTLTTPQKYASFSAVPAVDKYRRETPKEETEYEDTKKKNSHKFMYGEYTYGELLVCFVLRERGLVLGMLYFKVYFSYLRLSLYHRGSLALV